MHIPDEPTNKDKRKNIENKKNKKEVLIND